MHFKLKRYLETQILNFKLLNKQYNKAIRNKLRKKYVVTNTQLISI